MYRRRNGLFGGPRRRAATKGRLRARSRCGRSQGCVAVCRAASVSAVMLRLGAVRRSREKGRGGGRTRLVQCSCHGKGQQAMKKVTRLSTSRRKGEKREEEKGNCVCAMYEYVMRQSALSYICYTRGTCNLTNPPCFQTNRPAMSFIISWSIVPLNP